MVDVHGAIALIGGAPGSLDAIDGSELADNDIAQVFVKGVGTYTYILDAYSGAIENPPGIIAPDTNAGTKRWILHSAMSVDVGLLKKFGSV